MNRHASAFLVVKLSESMRVSVTLQCRDSAPANYNQLLSFSCPTHLPPARPPSLPPSFAPTLPAPTSSSSLAVLIPTVYLWVEMVAQAMDSSPPHLKAFRPHSSSGWRQSVEDQSISLRVPLKV